MLQPAELPPRLPVHLRGPDSSSFFFPFNCLFSIFDDMLIICVITFLTYFYIELQGIVMTEPAIYVLKSGRVEFRRYRSGSETLEAT